MGDGYLYCFSNESMTGILKIGKTERTIEERLKEANTSDTWRPPTPYKCELAKYVRDVSHKELILHKLLGQYTERINPRREFFRVTIEEVFTFFELIDGVYWTPPASQAGDDDGAQSIEGDDGHGCRDITKCFSHGQQIRHTIGINKMWIGIYDDTQKCILCNEQTYKTPSSMSSAHYKVERPDRTCRSNGWSECECEVAGQWISIFSLPELHQA